MKRSWLICGVVACALALSACKPKTSPPSKPTEPASPSSKVSLPVAPDRRQALEHCEAFMGYEKNECLDKVRQVFPQTVA